MSANMLSTLSEHPEKVFEFSKNEGNHYFDSLVKQFLDPITKEYSVLDEIYVDGLDSSQIYGQTRMVLDGVGDKLIHEVLPALQAKNVDNNDEEGDEDVEGEEESGVEDDNNEQNESLSDDSEDEGEERNLEESGDENLGEIMGELSEEDVDEEPSRGEEDRPQTFKKDTFGLNDEFFDIDSFNKQILSLEKPEDDDEIDYMDSMSEEDEDEEVAYFDDFFPKPAKQETRESAQDPSSSEEEGEEPQEQDLSEGEYENALGSAMLDIFEDKPQKNTPAMSSFEAHQKQIQEEVAKLEAELIAEKKWTMKGEVTAKSRPEDSLLEDPETMDLEFDRTAKPVPVITQEHTETVEDMIRRRIKAEEFDDLPRRVVGDVAKFHKERVEVSEQKSTKSLAELYEDEYNQADPQTEVSDETKKQHEEIDQLFSSLNHKLDSLCSAHYVPKPHQGRSLEIKVDDVTAPTISMEDAQPAYVDSGTSLAPQEIYKPGEKQDGKVTLKSGLSYAKDELSRDDKQRLRRANKRKRAKEHSHRESSGKKSNKKQNTNDVVSTLARAKNVTLIDKKGRHTDVKGKERKETTHSSSQYML
ncbi:U3 small nucleolar RNA-associated protein MPP10 [Meyerozyma sp. JA9]|nr:U3 small nucleolar RNA-associated protein MPP10 [Meyerozyma sp. JA9]